MRSEPTVLHLDLDAFFASVEQRDKPSLRGKPVIVGGIGPRGVVSTASYEARTFGVHSAMSTAQARALCPHAAFLNGRFGAYRATSRRVMRVLRDLSPIVEPLSLDEAFVDLTASALDDFSPTALETAMRDLKASVHEASGGIAGSAGVATSKLIAKIASDLDKPDGLRIVGAGTERDLIRPMQVTVIPGVGPATSERLRRAGIHTVADAERVTEAELVRLLGNAHGHSLHKLVRADDDRPVESQRETKSVSVEDTFDTDLVDATLLRSIVARHAAHVCERLRAARLSGRTVTVKIRLYDFTTHSRSATLPAPTDDARVVSRLARQLVDDVDTGAGVRLLGVAVSGLADWIQEDLFGDDEEPDEPPSGPLPAVHQRARYVPGGDVVHRTYGPGWVWGAGLGRVTVRFETAATPPGPVRTFGIDDPDLEPARPEDDDGDADDPATVSA
ncbi:DNA polymerase IV [Solicola gregarius]|uniref:DNA polymerase IV n=1 Tax=Solicola gregarius TaxID=2908642 RepID=A0AA46YL62_9ACTN|nr:DNA polymerase IV [Solicola gregarius]UYM05294.1 DNA polymerase IV [Solicola gregarius]